MFWFGIMESPKLGNCQDVTVRWFPNKVEAFMSEVSGNHYSAAIVKGQGAIQPLYQSGLREYCSCKKKCHPIGDPKANKLCIDFTADMSPNFGPIGDVSGFSPSPRNGRGSTPGRMGWRWPAHPWRVNDHFFGWKSRVVLSRVGCL